MHVRGGKCRSSDAAEYACRIRIRLPPTRSPQAWRRECLRRRSEPASFPAYRPQSEERQNRDTSAHFPKFVLHRSNLFLELRNVMGTSIPIDSSTALSI